MNTKRYKRIRIGAAVLVGMLLCGCVWLFWPVSESCWQRSAVLLENEWQYALEVEGQRICFSGCDESGLKEATLHRGKNLNRRYGLAWLVSPWGHLRTDSALLAPPLDSLWFVGHGAEVLEQTVNCMEEEQKRMAHQLEELTYYERTHFGEDDGYEEMCGLHREQQIRKQTHDTLLQLLKKAAAHPELVRWYYMPQVKAYYSPDGSRRRYSCEALQWSAGRGTCRLVEKALPEGASFIANPWFDPFDRVVMVDSLRPAAEGVCLTPGSRRHVALLRDAAGQEYVGEVLGNVPDGLGMACFSDSSSYKGHWREGYFQGRGEYTDASAVRYRGDWEGHHLLGGEAFYPNGDRYQGSFLNDSIRDGAGDLFYADGSVYCGTWEDNLRQGFGMYVGAGDVAKCGMWKDDRFQGERLLYTADRVYGIDISRYQHLNRRKRPCNIGWKYLRITHLGRLSRKRVHESTVSYPISFIYIKATEGATVLNPYYKADREQAARHGYLQGCYHFFSSAPVEEQLEWFFKHAVVRKGDLPPVLDLEPTDDYIRRRWGSDEVMFAQVLHWLRAVEQHYGVRPVLYVNQMFIMNHLSKGPAELKAYDLWVARYGEFKPYSHMVHWQISPDGRVSGIQSDVDINVFNGSKERFREYVESVAK